MGVTAGYYSISAADLTVALHWDAYRRGRESGSPNQNLLRTPEQRDPLWFLRPNPTSEQQGAIWLTSSEIEQDRAADQEYTLAAERGEILDLDKSFHSLAFLLSTEYRESEGDRAWAVVPYDMEASDPLVAAIFGSRRLHIEPWTPYNMPHDVRWIADALSARDWAAEIATAQAEGLSVRYTDEALRQYTAEITAFYKRAAAAGRAVIVDIE
ncbi:MAG TPA: DUF1877 family protein [Rubricoccaceae bacterium]|jgi:hypothetical protein